MEARMRGRLAVLTLGLALTASTAFAESRSSPPSQDSVTARLSVASPPVMVLTNQNADMRIQVEKRSGAERGTVSVSSIAVARYFYRNRTSTPDTAPVFLVHWRIPGQNAYNSNRQLADMRSTARATKADSLLRLPAGARHTIGTG